MQLAPFAVVRWAAVPYNLLEVLNPQWLDASWGAYQSAKAHWEASVAAGDDATVAEQQYLQWKKQWEAHWEEALGDARIRLQQVSRVEALRYGLAHNAWSLYGQWEKYIDIKPQDFRKKERQTERGLLKYLRRAAAKTSPFSTFTTLGLGAWDAEETPMEWDVQVRWEVNRRWMAYVQAHLWKHPIWSKYIPLRLTPSFCTEQTHVRWLKVMAEGEWVQEAEGESRTALEALSTFFGGASKSRAAVIDFLEAASQAPRQTVERYVEQLLENGFLHPDFGVQPLEEAAYPMFLKALKAYLGKDTEAEPLLRDLQEVEVLKHVEGIDLWQQRATVEALLERIRVALRAEHAFSATALYYESAFQKKPYALPKELEQVLTPLASLGALLQKLGTTEHLQREYQAFWTQHYPKETAVPLLRFYADYVIYRQGKPRPTQSTQAITGKLQTEWESQKGHTLTLDVDLLARALDEYTQPNTRPFSQGAALQHYYEEGQLKCIVNNFFEGYGKQYVRYLRYAPQADRHNTALRAWNLQETEAMYYATYQETSFFNANIQAAQFDDALPAPDATPVLQTQNALRWEDLEVVQLQQTIVLWDKARQKRVCILNMDLQGLDTRTPFYQFLIELSTHPFFSPKHLLNTWAEMHRTPEKSFIVPAVHLSAQLQLARKTWFMRAEDLPRRAPSESSAAYHGRWLDWQKTWALPETCFFRIAGHPYANSDENTHPEAHKPQWITWSNPLCLHELERLANTCTGYIEIRGMQPHAHVLPRIHGAAHATELLVNWTHEASTENPKETATTASWQSLHLFYTDLSMLLTQAVFPALEILQQKAWCTRYFFIRYTEGGPHIRLRLWMDDTLYNTEVKSWLEAYFAAFFQKNPSTRSYNSHFFKPNNNLEWAEYLPETTRYGGTEGLRWTERHFVESSQHARALLLQSQTPMALAIQMLTIQAQAWGWSQATAKVFFAINWSVYQESFIEEDMDHKEAYKARKHWNAQQAEYYTEHATQWQTAFQTLWRDLEAKQPLQNPTLQRWAYTCTRWTMQAKQIHPWTDTAHPIAVRSALYGHVDATQPYWPWISDLMHLTRNRLGLSLSEEATCVYCLMRLFEALPPH